MNKEEIIEQQLEIVKLETELNHKKKHLDWFDYQQRGGRFKGKEPKEIAEDRAAIVEEIQELEKKLSEAYSSD